MNLTTTTPDYDPPAGHLPDRVRLFGMAIFLAALSMLFIAAIGLYLLVRLQLLNADAQPDPPLGALTVPPLLWLSSLLMIASTFAVQLARQAIAAGRDRRFLQTLVTAAALALVFLAVQVPALYQLVQRHAVLAQRNVYLYAIIALLLILHALHVVGGLVALGVVTRDALRHRYSRQSHLPVRLVCLYWHFLDAVWLVMFLAWVLIG